MCPDQADLLGHRARPWSGRLTHDKATNGNKVSTRPVRIENALTHVDFDLFPIGINGAELSPNRRILLIDFSPPQRSALRQQGAIPKRAGIL